MTKMKWFPEEIAEVYISVLSVTFQSNLDALF